MRQGAETSQNGTKRNRCSEPSTEYEEEPAYLRPFSFYYRPSEEQNKTAIGYSLMDLEELNERRIFFLTPGRLLLEAVLRGEG